MASLPHDHDVPVEPGIIEADTREEVESAYAGSTRETDTASLRSSILAYKQEHGRRYHAYKDGAYWGPNDDEQQEAEDIGHHMYRLVLGDKLYLAPIRSDPHSVIDVGCGTGLWAMDFADQHPSAEVIGIDLSPIQPPFVPPNCRFQVDDMEEDWTFPENHFDLVHLRHMTGCFSDLKKFHAHAFKYVKPGGWIEQVELSAQALSDDGSLEPDAALAIWWNLFREFGAKAGKPFTTSEDAHDAVKAAGYTNVVLRQFKVPIGPWPRNKSLKTWGAWNRAFLLDGLEGFALRGLTTILNWSYEETQLYLDRVRADLQNPRKHSYIYLRAVYGQKPESSN